MVKVTWQQARDFCQWAGGDLPTEAQWEKAARGVDGREYPWGEEFDLNRLWCSRMSFGGLRKSTAPVGAFLNGASPYGVLDMSGNVWEWCLDWYGESYSGLPDRNPTGIGFAKRRVVRGGCWYDDGPEPVRAANRDCGGPAERSHYYGFRLVGPP